MGIDMLSNTAATYNTTPKEAVPKTTNVSNYNVGIQDGTQKLVDNETKAVKYANNDESGEKGSGGWAKEEQSKEQTVKSAVSNANKKASLTKTECEFKYHEETKRISISIKDKETGKIVKEIPPEETLDMLGKMWELAGLFIDDKR